MCNTAQCIRPYKKWCWGTHKRRIKVGGCNVYIYTSCICMCAACLYDILKPRVVEVCVCACVCASIFMPRVWKICYDTYACVFTYRSGESKIVWSILISGYPIFKLDVLCRVITCFFLVFRFPSIISCRDECSVRCYTSPDPAQTSSLRQSRPEKYLRVF